MYLSVAHWLIFCTLLAQSACAGSTSSESVPSLTDKPQQVPDPAPNELNATEVLGALGPLPGLPSSNENALFASAIDYAVEQHSWALLVWQGGRLRVEEYMNGASVESRPLSASMHKTVFAMVVGLAIQDGILAGLDSPVGDYLQEWTDDSRGLITLRQLLWMSSGLTTLSRDGGGDSEWAKFQRGEQSEDLLLGRTAVRAPDTTFEYLNVNTNIVGLALQRSLERSYASYLSQRLWQPIGAGSAYVVPVRPDGMVNTASNFMSSGRDWLRIGLLIKDDGKFYGQQILPDGWIETMLAPSTLNPNYGLHVWRATPYVAERYYNNQEQGFKFRASEPFLAADMVYLDGLGGQRVYVSRGQDLVIVRLGPRSLDWDDSSLPNRVVRALQARAPLDD